MLRFLALSGLLIASSSTFLNGAVGQVVPAYVECKLSVDAPPARLAGRVPLPTFNDPDFGVSYVDFNNDFNPDFALLSSQGSDFLLFMTLPSLSAGDCDSGFVRPPPPVAPARGGAVDFSTIDIRSATLPAEQIDFAVAQAEGLGVVTNMGLNNGVPQFTAAAPNRDAGKALSVATGDFDGDTFEDVVVGTEDRVVFFYGRNTPPFLQEAQTANVRGDIVVVADLDRDGHPDVLVLSGSSSGSPPISVFMNRNQDNLQRFVKTAGAALSGELPTDPVAMAVGYFDDNSSLDLAIIDGPQVLLRLNTPTLTATAMQTVTPSPTSTRTLTPELIETATHSPTGSVEPTETLTATATVTPTPTATPTATRTPIETPGLLRIYLQNTRPPTPTGAPESTPQDVGFSSAPTPNYPAGRGPAGVAVSDFNRDGKLDVAVSSTSDDRVMFFYGNGDREGTFDMLDACPEDACFDEGDKVAGCCVGAGARAILVTSIDVGTDLLPDLLVTNADGHSVSVLLSGNPPPTLTGTPTSTPTITSTPGPTNTPSETRTITPIPTNTSRPTATCPPTGICVQGEGCVMIAAPQSSAAVAWPWIGAVVLWLVRRSRRGC